MQQQNLSNSVKIFSIDRNKLLRELKGIARQIGAEHARVQTIRLFGSMARGDQVGTSDADILIVVRNNEQTEVLDQIRLFYAYFDLPIGVDLLVYSEEEIEHRLQTGDPFLSRIWAESQLLYP